MMKIVIYQPYTEIWFKNQTRRILRKKKLPNKYEGLFDYIASSNDHLYITTRLVYSNGWKGFWQLITDAFRLIIWCLVNKINLRKVGLIFIKKQLLDKDAIIFMHYGVFAHEQEFISIKGKILSQEFSNIPIFKIVHMTHYPYNIELGSKNLEELNPNLLIGENNLKKNSPFFRKYFKECPADFYTLPYTPAPRFQRIREFSERLNKLLVTGSITYKMVDKDYVNFYCHNELQPMRRLIYENKNKYSDQLESQIFDLNEIRLEPLKRNTNDISTASYYKKNIVDTYNSFKMFAVPEEACDLPGIGFIEGMACGAAFFGIDSPMYRDLGMIPGIHYITYDGTLENLIERVIYYQVHQNELEEIAEMGWKYSRRYMDPKLVYGGFIETLRSLVNTN